MGTIRVTVPIDKMNRLLLFVCALVALTSATRFRSGNTVHGYPSYPSSRNFANNPVDVSAYFYNFLKDYFPNYVTPSVLLGAEYLGMDLDGTSAAPVKFSVSVKLETTTCTAIVHLGNPVSGGDKLYYGEELTNCI